MLNDVLRVGSGGPLGDRDEVIGGHSGRRGGNFICVGRVSRVVPLPIGESITSTGRIRITIGGDGCLVRSSFLHIFEDHFTVYAVGISDGIARHCDFTGGDGEVDRYVLIAVLDREGRFAVEGGVVHAVDIFRFDRLRVDLDGVGFGVGVSGYLFPINSFGLYILVELLLVIEFELRRITKIRRGDTCGQRVLDRAIVQAGDDGVGDILEDFDQVLGRLCIICIFFIRTFCGLRCNAFLQEVANRTTAIIQ